MVAQVVNSAAAAVHNQPGACEPRPQSRKKGLGRLLVLSQRMVQFSQCAGPQGFQEAQEGRQLGLQRPDLGVLGFTGCLQLDNLVGI